MGGRPYWSGQIRISLVAFPVTLSSALRRSSQVPLHEVDRKSGERVHHKNVTAEGDEVLRENVIKSFSTDDGEVMLEPDEIDAIKLPSSDTLELVTFTDLASIPPARFERPYFVLPDGRDAGEIYAVIHEALLSSNKAGIGQIAMRGREELCALVPRPEGLMLETLRYDNELDDGGDFFPPRKAKLKPDYVALAHQLIEKNSSPAADFSAFHDHYHEALKELIKAKQAHRKPKLPKAGKAPAKVVDFMDALKKSLGGSKTRASSAKGHKSSGRRKSA